jgi:hypothetical protein
VGIVVAPDGLKAYVAAGSGALVVVDVSGPAPVLADAAPTSLLRSIAMAPDGTGPAPS